MRIFDFLNHLFNFVGWIKGWFKERDEYKDKKARADAEAGLRVQKQKNANRRRVTASQRVKDMSDEEWLAEQRKK